MVRMCTSMTVACATVLVAGSVAGAADRSLVKNAAVNKSVEAAPYSFRQVMPVDANASVLGTGTPSCECPGWDNGTWDGNNGQLSHLGGGAPWGSMAADDFYLDPCSVHDLVSVSGFLITNSNPGIRKAKAIIWSDCNGCPKDALYTFTESEIVGVPQDLGGGYFLVQYKFVMQNQNEVEERNIVLKGGCYWFSLMGRTDGQCPVMNMCDLSFFATTGDGYVKGSVARKIDGIPTTNGLYSFSSSCGGTYGWNAVDECCIGCTDLAFTICANPCHILVDNGNQITAATQSGGYLSEKGHNGSVRNTRAADDFVVNPCSDFTICYIEGCIYTNCDGFDGFFEIYRNTCKKPNWYFGDQVVAGRDWATKIVDLGFSVTIGTTSGLRAYRVEFHDLSILLTRGHTYWISVGAIDTFSFLEKAYFCCNYDCRRPCLTKWNVGKYLNTDITGVYPGTPVGWRDACDFAFLVAGEYTVTRPGGSGSSTACVGDIDANGTVDADDLFTFLDAWFTGCP